MFERAVFFVVSRRLTEAEPWIDDRVADVRTALADAAKRAEAAQPVNT